VQLGIFVREGYHSKYVPHDAKRWSDYKKRQPADGMKELTKRQSQQELTKRQSQQELTKRQSQQELTKRRLVM